MRITCSRLIPYQLPLRRPWRSAHGTLTHRSGWQVQLETDSGLVGNGDCAPLPEAGTESPETAARALHELLPKLQGNEVSTTLPDGLPPAARCAVETALLNLLAHEAGVPLARWLNPAAATTVAVNAAIGALEDGAAARMQTAIEAGFRVLKLKVGLSAPAQELAILRAQTRGLPPGIALRLDANGAWTLAQAQYFLDGLSGLPIESLEEPLTMPDAQTLRQLQAAAPFPLAADESLARLGAEFWLASPSVRRLVLKPMVLGGLLPALALAQRAAAIGMACVVTTTLDSAIGTRATAHLAAALHNGLAHGLDTSRWLAEDLATAPVIENGQWAVDI